MQCRLPNLRQWLHERRPWSARLLCLAMLAASAAPGLAQGTRDLTECTAAQLHAAVGKSNYTTINLLCDGTITLTNTLKITRNTRLDGSGHRVIISGGGENFRLFQVETGITFTVINLTLVNGVSTQGGAIYNNRGFVELTDCILSNNLAQADAGAEGARGHNSQFTSGRDGRSAGSGRSAFGGALFNLRGTSIVSHCSFFSNEAFGGRGGEGGQGGDGYTAGGHGGHGGNGGRGFGGAIFNAGSLLVSNSTFYLNQATGGNGGAGGGGGNGSFAGLSGQGGSGGAGSGGAIYNTNRASAFIWGSTFYLNSVRSGASADAGSNQGNGRTGPKGPDASGGAFSNNGTGGFVNCTFVGNSVRGGSGGRGGSSASKGGNGGGAGSAWGGSLFNSSRANVWSCTFVDGAAVAGTNGLEGAGSVRGRVGSIGRTRGAHLGSNRGQILLGNTLVYNPAGSATNLFETNSTCVMTITNNVMSNGTLATRIICTNQILHRSDGYDQTNTTCGNNVFAGTNLVAGSNEVCSPASIRQVTLSLNRSIGYGVFQDAGFNLFSDRTIRLRRGSDSKVTNSSAFMIGSLADNGGLTETIALLPGSPAINAGGTNLAVVPGVDQRDVMRNTGGRPDIGAYEYGLTLLPPVILDPPLGQAVRVGATNVIFSVEVQSDPPILYQWRRDRVFLTNGNTSSYTISSVTTNDAGNYDVIVANNAGAVTSIVATLTIITPVAITQQPVSVTVDEGASATFHVVATGQGPLNYQWTFNQTQVLASATSNSLTLPQVQEANAGSYQVRVFNTFSSVTSVVATLTVTTNPPSITTQPDSLVLSSGTTASFTVVAAGTRPLRYQWFFESDPIPRATNAIFTINSAQTTNAGTYYVIVTNIHGTATSDSVTLDVSDEPPNIVSQSTSLDAIRGTNLTLAVEAGGSRPLTYQWFADNEPIAGATNATLVVTNVTYTNAVNYFVNIANEFGTLDSATITVTVVAAITKMCETQAPQRFCTIEFPNEIGIEFMLQFRDNPGDAWTDLGEPLSNDNPANTMLPFIDDTADGDEAREYRVLGFPIMEPEEPAKNGLRR